MANTNYIQKNLHKFEQYKGFTTKINIVLPRSILYIIKKKNAAPI